MRPSPCMPPRPCTAVYANVLRNHERAQLYHLDALHLASSLWPRSFEGEPWWAPPARRPPEPHGMACSASLLPAGPRMPPAARLHPRPHSPPPPCRYVETRSALQRYQEEAACKDAAAAAAARQAFLEASAGGCWGQCPAPRHCRHVRRAETH